MYYYLGNHKKIREYREKESLKITLERRPDLIKNKNNLICRMNSEIYKKLFGI